MARVSLLSDDSKVGSLAEQREAIGPVDVEWGPEDRSVCLSPPGTRPDDVLCIAHARVLGNLKQREMRLADLAARNVAVQLPGDEPVTYDTPEKVAAFHAEAVRPTGKPSRKQRRLMGRPLKYPRPNDEQRAKLLAWWNGPQHTDDVETLAGELMGRKVPRVTLAAWLGKRAPHPGRRRKSSKRKPTK